MIGEPSGIIPVLYASLVIFGVAYNALYAWLERRGYDEGYLAAIVALGVAGVIAALALLDWRWALLTFGAFACAGAPMAIGSWHRHVKRRRAAQAALRAEVLR